MKNILLYIITVLIWGSTWIAIEFQVDDVNVTVSVMYRFVIAAVLMWIFCLWRKLPMRFSLVDHGYFVLLAFGCFSFNYIFMYWAQAYLTSAMASIAFSTLLIMNICNTQLFFKKAITVRVYIGAVIGIAGIVSLFWHDIRAFNLESGTLQGLGLALLGTMIASLGNMVSVRNSNRNVGIVQGNAWGTTYGAITLFLVVLVTGADINLPTNANYFYALGFLSVFGTVIAFGCYFALLKNIGPEKASYAIVLFPVVAVIIGSYFDGFTWYYSTIVGFILVLLGNAIVLFPKSLWNKLTRQDSEWVSSH